MAMGTGYSKAAKKHKKAADAIRKLEEGAGPKMEGPTKAPRKTKAPKKPKMKTSYGAAAKMEGVAQPKPPKIDVQPTKLQAATRRLDKQAAARQAKKTTGKTGSNMPKKDVKKMAKKAVKHVQKQKAAAAAPKPKAPGAQVRVTRTTPRGSFSAAQRVAGKAQETGQAQVTSVRSSGMGRVKAPSQAAAPPRVHSVSGGKFATHGTVMDVAGPGKGSFITEKPGGGTSALSRKYAERQVARGQATDVSKARGYRSRVSSGIRQGGMTPQQSMSAAAPPPAGEPVSTVRTGPKPAAAAPKPAAAPAATQAAGRTKEAWQQRLARKTPSSVRRALPAPHHASMEGAAAHLRSAAAPTGKVAKIIKPIYRGTMRAASRVPLVALGAQVGGMAGAKTGETGTGTVVGAATGAIAQGTLSLGSITPGLRAASKGVRFLGARAAAPVAVAETGVQVYKLQKAMRGARKAQKGQAVHGEGLKKMGFAVKKEGFFGGAATAFSNTKTANVSVIQRSPEKTAAATKEMRAGAKAEMTPGARKTLGKLKAARKKKKDSRPKPF